LQSESLGGIPRIEDSYNHSVALGLRYATPVRLDHVDREKNEKNEYRINGNCLPSTDHNHLVVRLRMRKLSEPRF